MRKRYIRVDVMLNEEENDKLKKDSDLAFISKSEYIRRLIMNKKIREKPDDRFYDVMFQMTKIGNNLNQIAHRANYEKAIDKNRYDFEAKKWNAFMNEVKNKFL